MSPRHWFPTYAISLDDDPATQYFEKYDTVLSALNIAHTTTINPDFEWANIFPGEHYRLLAGLVSAIQPKCSVDIGTFKGCSSRILLDYCLTSEVHTFDLYSYDSFDWTVLSSIDFDSGRFFQYLDDLSNLDVFNKHEELLNSAEFIMLDGPKDGVFERTFLELCQNLRSSKTRWLFIDDIKFSNMWELWRTIKSPKLDLTSFGHFSGSGLVDISQGLTL